MVNNLQMITIGDVIDYLWGYLLSLIADNVLMIEIEIVGDYLFAIL